MKKENVELIEEEEIITLYDDNNKPVDFYEVACVEYKDEYYALMQPVQPLEGLGEDEAIIFKLQPQDDETDLFVPVDDEEVLNAVFEEYLQATAGHCDCCGEGDCDCDDGECDCGEHKCDSENKDCGCGEHHCDCGAKHE